MPRPRIIRGDEIMGIIKQIFLVTINREPRLTDTLTCLAMTGSSRGQQGIDELIKTTCDFIHDHYMGEPDRPSAKKLYDTVRPKINKLYAKTKLEK